MISRKNVYFLQSLILLTICVAQAQSPIETKLWQPYYITPRSGSQHLALDFARNYPEITNHFVEYKAGRVPWMLSRASHIDNMQSPSIESMAEASQISAGEFYQLMLEGMQANYPRTAGIMPWVYKRPWPVFSAIMLIDGFGQPVAPYYFLKRTYQPTQVTLQLPYLLWALGEEMILQTAVIHQGDALPAGLQLRVKVYNDQWKQVWHQEKKFPSLAPGPVVLKDTLGNFTIPADFRDRFFFAVAELGNDHEVIARSVYWPRCLQMMEAAVTRQNYREAPQPYRTQNSPWPTLENGPWLKPTVQQTEQAQLQINGITSLMQEKDNSHLQIKITNSGKVPALMTQLDIDNTRRLFYAVDNFFWLAPGETRTLQMHIQWQEPVKKGKALLKLSAWNAKPVSKKIQ